jgi:hypothetical protein
VLRPRHLALPICGLLAGTALAAPHVASSPLPLARDAAPVVLTGAQLPGWSVPAVQGVAQPWPSGVTDQYSKPIDPALAVRTAHNGTLAPAVVSGVPVDEVAAYSWTGSAWREVPVQVDERFPYFLANSHSDFGFYSGTDQELTYAWGPTRHSVGEEAWKKVFGTCAARYADTPAEAQQAIDQGLVTPGPQETAADYTHAMADPVAGVDDDDEIALQARDAGAQAPPGTPAPAGATDGQTVAIADPLDPAASRYLYLFTQPGGSSFTADTGAVQMTRTPDADTWMDKTFFPTGSPEALGVSNGGYGPNLHGTVCDPVTGEPRPSTDRFPRDAMTVSTPTYKVTATGRWMVRGFQVRDAASPEVVCRERGKSEGQGQGKKLGHLKDCTPVGTTYGPDLIDRWKGRAFQQNPDSTVSVVGFEDEQVNWEANSALLGWRQGPVRAIREVWGADSGTNVTKTETYYRDADTYRYRVRVHPIPPDGLYTSWDYNKDVASTYYNLVKPDGVPIDGHNDDQGSIDQLPTGQPAYFDAPDPTFDVPSAVDRPEEVAGRGSAGALVYTFEFKGATSAANAAAVPYYRDDACLDDGTGDDPVQRPWPGEAYEGDPKNRVKSGYEAANGGTPFDTLKAACQAGTATPFQGAFGSHGIHFFVTHDSDNATLGVPVDEVDGQQWRYSVPMRAPGNVIAQYAPNVLTPRQALVTPFL